MSYLIGLYVYYHGNNLEVFGIRRGLTQEQPQNQGTKRPEEIDPSLVPKELIDAAIKNEQKEMETRRNDWDNIMRDAIQKSQQETFRMHKSGVIQNTVFDNTVNAVMDDYDDAGSIPLDFFTTINQ